MQWLIQVVENRGHIFPRRGPIPTSTINGRFGLSSSKSLSQAINFNEEVTVKLQRDEPDRLELKVTRGAVHPPRTVKPCTPKLGCVRTSLSLSDARRICRTEPGEL